LNCGDAPERKFAGKRLSPGGKNKKGEKAHIRKTGDGDKNQQREKSEDYYYSKGKKEPKV